MNKKIAVVMLILLMVFIGFGIVIPILPHIIMDAGNNELHLGLMLSIYSLLAFLVSPLWGALSEKVGRRSIILTGTIGFCMSYLLFGFADGQLWMMYLSRIVGGIFSGAVAAVIVAYVADITTIEQRTKGMALIGMSIGLGFTFGPAFGGLLSKYGSNVPFFSAAVLTFITYILGFILLKESLPPATRNLQREIASSRWSAFTGRMKYLYILSFFVTFSLAAIEATLLYFEAKRIPNITIQQIGYMFFFCGIAGAFVQGGIVRKYIQNGGEKKAIAFGLFLSASGFLLLLFSSTIVNATIYLCVFGIGNAFIRPCVISLITQKTTVSQGIAAGLTSSMDSFGRILGPLLAIILFKVHINFPYIMGAILNMVALYLLARFVVLDQTQSTTNITASKK